MNKAVAHMLLLIVTLPPGFLFKVGDSEASRVEQSLWLSESQENVGCQNQDRESINNSGGDK